MNNRSRDGKFLFKREFYNFIIVVWGDSVLKGEEIELFKEEVNFDLLVKSDFENEDEFREVSF